MTSKKLFQILLPLYDNEGVVFPSKLFKAVRRELTEKFGGLTTYSRAPATGLWKDGSDSLTVDKIVVYEVIADSFDVQYWRKYKTVLIAQFRQEDIIIRCSNIELI